MINLLPPKRLLTIRIARSNTVLKRYILLVLVGMMVLAAAVSVSYYFLHSQQKDIAQTLDLEQQKARQLEPVQKQAEELSATVNTIAALSSRSIKFSELLTSIGGVMPNGAVLTGLQFSIEDLDSPLVISAKVENEQLAAVLRNNLASSALFKKAEIESIRVVEEAEGAAGTADTAAPPTTQPDSPYRYVTIINAYLKDVKAKQ